MEPGTVLRMKPHGMKPTFGRDTKEERSSLGEVEYLVIDTSHIAHRSAHALERFKTSDGRISGHIYGSFKTLRNLIASYRPKNLVFVYDRGSPWRAELLPEYKANRRLDSTAPATEPPPSGVYDVHEGPKADWTPAPDVERLFRGFPGVQLAHTGAEADDLAAWFVREHTREMRSGAIALYTGDRDYWQLVSDKDLVAGIITKKAKGPIGGKGKPHNINVVIREEQVLDEFGVSPKYVARLKALFGDASDNIKGLQGASRPGKKDGIREFVCGPEAARYFDKTQSVSTLNSVSDWLAEELLRQRPAMLTNLAVIDLNVAVDALNQQVSASTGPREEVQLGHVAGCLEVLVEFECESLLGQVEPLFKELIQR